MKDPSIEEQVASVVDRLLGRPVQNALAPAGATLDVSRPNIHDHKSEYLREKGAVDRALEGISGLLEAVLGDRSKKTPEHEAMFSRLRTVVDHGARRRLAVRRPDSTSELIRMNAIQDGLTINALQVLLDYRQELTQRLAELKVQERQFWAVKHRPANYFARAVALRLARLYAAEEGERPSYGTSRDGGHPSTEYCRALEEIYGILEIKASVKSAAKWAVNNLTDDDLKTNVSSSIGDLLTVVGGGNRENAYLTLEGAFRISDAE
ncbi:hypothetical protein [Fluviibacterium sp. S390]|uniref:hypothetical protein n=1 Tax=Fluviibacterium sp. S390 TaxID=3415139 RepID=UPI003C7D5BA4